MLIYHLWREKSPEPLIMQTVEAVVVAHNELEARNILREKCQDEGQEAWGSEASCCEAIGQSYSPPVGCGVVCRHTIFQSPYEMGKTFKTT